MKIMASAVLFERHPLERTVRWRTVANELSMGYFVRRPPNRARQQMADPFLQDAVRWQPYCVFDPLGFEKLINFGIGKTRVCPEINARDFPLVAFDNRRQHTLPSVGAVDVAGTKRAALHVPELIEQKQRMITRAAKMAVPHAHLRFAVGGADA